MVKVQKRVDAQKMTSLHEQDGLNNTTVVCRHCMLYGKPEVKVTAIKLFR